MARHRPEKVCECRTFRLKFNRRDWLPGFISPGKANLNRPLDAGFKWRPLLKQITDFHCFRQRGAAGQKNNRFRSAAAAEGPGAAKEGTEDAFAGPPERWRLMD